MKYTIVLIFTLLSFSFWTQLKVSNQALLELEQNIFEKQFSKKWKKLKQSEWEQKCKEVKSISEISELFNTYSDLMAQTNSFSLGNFDGTTELEFVQYLLKVEGTLPTDYTATWNAESRTNWKESLQKFVDVQDKKQKEEVLMARFQKVSKTVSSFEKEFPKIWEDSKKNAFKNLLKGDLNTQTNNTNVELSNAQNVIIYIGEYNVKSFTITYDTEGDDKLPEKLIEELEAIIMTNAGTGYKKGNEMDPKFINSNKKAIQFEGEKFAETAKKPTVTIGVTKDYKEIIVTVTEPVFGH